MEKLKDRLLKQVTRREILEEDISRLNYSLDNLSASLVNHIEAREIIQKAAELTQEHIGEVLTELVSKALGLVFDYMDLGFSVQFVKRRNTTECDMFITEDGGEYDPLNSCGFGAADVASFALRVAMWNMNKTDNVMIFDEPFRNLDSDQMIQASLLLSTISEELGLQIIVVTHKEELKANAEKIYRVVKSGPYSKVHEEKTPRRLTM